MGARAIDLACLTSWPGGVPGDRVDIVNVAWGAPPTWYLQDAVTTCLQSGVAIVAGTGNSNRQSSYATPVLTTLAGVRQIVCVNENWVTAHRADDGAVLWASPTAGDPVSFDYLPPGAQMFLIARPADRWTYC